MTKQIALLISLFPFELAFDFLIACVYGNFLALIFFELEFEVALLSFDLKCKKSY